MEQIFAMLADRRTRTILGRAYTGLGGSSSSYEGKMSKKQFYIRLRKLRDAGLIEKKSSRYNTTTFGSLVYNKHVKSMEEILENHGSLRAIDIIRADKDIPLSHKESIVNEFIEGSKLRELLSPSQLSGFTIVKDFEQLVHEVGKLLEGAQEQIYFATRYHDPKISAKLLQLHRKGITLNLLDGNPTQTSLESRLNAVLRTPHNKESYELVQEMIKSPRFNLRTCPVPVSFAVIDGRQAAFEVISPANPQDFTIGIASHDDAYLAQTLVKYFDSLAKAASAPLWLAEIRR
jgi:hypothetical protein